MSYLPQPHHHVLVQRLPLTPTPKEDRASINVTAIYEKKW